MADNSQAQIEVLMNQLDAERIAHGHTLSLLNDATSAVTDLLDENERLRRSLNRMIDEHGQEMAARLRAEQALQRATNPA